MPASGTKKRRSLHGRSLDSYVRWMSRWLESGDSEEFFEAPVSIELPSRGYFSGDLYGVQTGAMHDLSRKERAESSSTRSAPVSRYSFEEARKRISAREAAKAEQARRQEEEFQRLLYEVRRDREECKKKNARSGQLLRVVRAAIDFEAKITGRWVDIVGAELTAYLVDVVPTRPGRKKAVVRVDYVTEQGFRDELKTIKGLLDEYYKVDD